MIARESPGQLGNARLVSEPNVGVVMVPDERLQKIDSVVHSERIVPTTINFVDIAGLVRGASKGEGLGNQFLAHIREAAAIVQVARCFEDANIVHVENRDSVSTTRRPTSVCRYSTPAGASLSQLPLSFLVTRPRAATSLKATTSARRPAGTCVRMLAKVIGPSLSASRISTTCGWLTNSRRFATESHSSIVGTRAP